MMYSVRIHNSKECYNITYNVVEDDPVKAREKAIMRLVDETGTGIDQWEIIGVEKRA